MKSKTVMRSLRFTHGVSIKELADAAGVSSQYISSVELGTAYGKNLTIVQKAFETLIEKKSRQLEELKKAYADNKDRLLEFEKTEDTPT